VTSCFTVANCRHVTCLSSVTYCFPVAVSSHDMSQQRDVLLTSGDVSSRDVSQWLILSANCQLSASRLCSFIPMEGAPFTNLIGAR
jgi:hypothetical protein